MDHDERSIDELIEIAEEIPDRLGLAAGMAELRGSAQGEGVSLSVDVHGMLVDLQISDSALDLGPERLAAEISRLAAEASSSALQAGLRAVEAGCGPRLASTIAGYLGVEREPPTPAQPEPPAPTIGATRRRWSDDEPEEGFVLVRE